jgi:hypothetical protein
MYTNINNLHRIETNGGWLILHRAALLPDSPTQKTWKASISSWGIMFSPLTIGFSNNQTTALLVWVPHVHAAMLASTTAFLRKQHFYSPKLTPFSATG